MSSELAVAMIAFSLSWLVNLYRLVSCDAPVSWWREAIYVIGVILMPSAFVKVWLMTLR